MVGAPVVKSLHFYPVKSCRAVDLDSAYVSSRGLMSHQILDRSWMLINDKHVFISQREEPTLACVKVEVLNKEESVGHIRLSVEGLESIILDMSLVTDVRQQATLHGKIVVGHVASQIVNQWFSNFLNKPVQVLHQNEDDLRLCDGCFTVNPDKDDVSFADGHPYLITAQATLAKLNQSLASPVPMRRFRPNIVVGNAEAEAEYSWRTLAIGGARLSLVKPCTRCVVTTVDQERGVKTGKEPLATLARTSFLSQDLGSAHVQGAVFGENAVPTLCGKISVGDRVEIIDMKPVYKFCRTGSAAN
jgi:uncharacterized protein YcbX